MSIIHRHDPVRVRKIDVQDRVNDVRCEVVSFMSHDQTFLVLTFLSLSKITVDPTR